MNDMKEVPFGKVTSYGHIAKLIGKPQCPRQVGQALKHLPFYTPTENPTFHSNNVPWQRVISSNGTIPRREPGAADRHAQVLQGEGVAVDRKPDGRLCVDFSECGWFPEYLPSEADAYSSLSSTEEGTENGE